MLVCILLGALLAPGASAARPAQQAWGALQSHQEVHAKRAGRQADCCSETCAWNGLICASWPLFSSDDKELWLAECCTDDVDMEEAVKKELCAAVSPERKQAALAKAREAGLLPQEEEEDEEMGTQEPSEGETEPAREEQRTTGAGIEAATTNTTNTTQDVDEKEKPKQEKPKQERTRGQGCPKVFQRMLSAQAAAADRARRVFPVMASANRFCSDLMQFAFEQSQKSIDPEPGPGNDSVAAILRLYSSDDCEGDPHTEINLRTTSENHCHGCLDRCSSASSGFRSMRLEGGPGDAAAVAWNCVGSYNSYDSAGFARGGLVQANAGCHFSRGGGAVVLCSADLANDNYLQELSATCGAFYAPATGKIPMEVFLEEVALSQLRAGEGICRKVLTGSLGSGPESQEWATEAAEPSEDGSLHKLGRLQTVKQSPMRPAWALELSLREVCKDECKELVQGIRDEVDHIVEDLQNASFAESCAQRVVKRVEAHILGCCADSCGWNEKTCVWWPFFSQTQRAQWEDECCAEQNILEGSERERMCDATLTKEQKEKLPRYSMNKDINGALIGQDRLVWMPSGVPHDRKDRAVSGDTVSNNFLLNSDVSARQGIRDKWWQVGAPATESSLLQHHYGEHGQRGLRSHSAGLSQCLEPFKAMSVAQELAGKWMMIPASYFPTACGTPKAEGQGPDDLGEACMAFKQNAKGDPVCFDVVLDVNKKASTTAWNKVWYLADEITENSADHLQTMRTLVFLKQSLRP
ncbi:unnamed protein product [Symbiodinium sp. CCMP2456]|nr:unnamed protein product [Symbiodinium sp. CCMP2456]